MNIDHLGKCSDRQHKATLAIAQQLLGVPVQLIASLPIVVRKGGTLIYHSAGPGPNPDMDYVNPYVMNGSFSLELRLKYLHALETGQKMENGHELKTLFDRLSKDSKESLRQIFRALTKDDLVCKKISKMLNDHQVQFKWDIEFLLGKNNLAFERWRYVYEQKGDIAWFCGYTQLKAALDRRIVDLSSTNVGAT